MNFSHVLNTSVFPEVWGKAVSIPTEEEGDQYLNAEVRV